MKSPKELLFELHAEAQPALDRIREGIVADIRPAPRGKPIAGFFMEAWTQLVWQSRSTWGALAAVWIVLLVISTTGSPDHALASNEALSPPLPTAAPGWEKHHATLRAELGLPPRKHAIKKPSAIGNQSRRRSQYAIA